MKRISGIAALLIKRTETKSEEHNELRIDRRPRFISIVNAVGYLVNFNIDSSTTC